MPEEASLSTFQIKESEKHVTKVLENDKFSLGSQKGGKPLQSVFFEIDF